MLKLITDALRAGRATETPPGPEGGFAGAAIGRFDLATPAPSAAALQAALELCPTRAISIVPGTSTSTSAASDGDAGASVALDDGRCVFCGLCADGEGAAFRPVAIEPMIARSRADLVRRFPITGPASAFTSPALDDGVRLLQEGSRLSEAIRRRLGRSLHIRHLDAGGCNGCDWELNQLQAPIYDLQRFGFDFVASPRHADLLLVSGVVTANLELALVRTLDAMPLPRLVVAMGACAISGGIFGTSEASRGGADRVVPVDAYVSGCPPRPWAILRALHLVLD